ncbi:butyrophilin subfamily 3 member A1-like [Sardina pilchardus]|uniref:butyrophilin subfamily 3 member A1-like n=1 Tax=Sardina pilchardus TaxID=27697 RepID=UPI002E0FD58D
MEDIFVIILPLFCWMATSTASLQVLGPAHPVMAFVGEDVLLPCYLSPNISAEKMTVTWMLNHTRALVVHHYTNGSDRDDQQHADYRGRTALFKEELSSGNISLKLTNVKVSDEANYTCSIQNENWVKNMSVQIKARARPQVLGPVHPVMAFVGEDVLLPCYLSPNISAENMTVTWMLNHTRALVVHHYTNGSDRDDQQQADYRGRTALFKEELSSGNISLKLTNVKVSDEANYTCSIHDGHWHEKISFKIKVNARPQVLGPVHPIMAFEGEDVLLPCYLSTNISAENMTVTWMLNHTRALVVHHYTNGSDRDDQQQADYRGRTALFKEELSSGNISLKLTNVKVSDEGDYTCSIQDGHWHEEISFKIRVNGRLTDRAHSGKAVLCVLLGAALAVGLSLWLFRVKRRLKESEELRLQKELEMTRMRSEVEEMRKYGVNVTLDPTTAHPQLVLSVDGKQVTHGDTPQSVAPSTERFATDLCVLAQEGFTSGAHYYEVQVRGKRDWTVGLVWEHANRNGPLKDCACDLYLALELRDGICYSTESRAAVVQLREDIQRVGVFVDYDEGIVNFYDVGDDYIAHLYSFSQYCFAGKTLYPVFSPGASGLKSVPLIVLPVGDFEFKPVPETV